MSEPTKELTSRTPATIAGEINRIKSQTGEILGAALNAARNSCFEIGKRLEEAKCLVPHGEWGKWLSENVDYSESTANNLMRIYREYGGEQIDMITGRSPREVFEGLSQSQLVALFAIPAAERTAYVEEHRDELEGGMSIRELQRQLEKYKAEAEAQKGRAESLSAALDEGDRQYDEKLKEIEQLRVELEEAKSTPIQTEIVVNQPSEEQLEAIRAEALREAREEAAGEYESLKEEYEAKALEAGKAAGAAGEVERIKAEYERQLRAARTAGNVRAQKVNLYLNDIARLLGAVSAELDAMNADESGAGDRIRAKVAVMLEKAMVERGFEI